MMLNEYTNLKLENPEFNPLPSLDIQGDISSKIASLLALEFLYVIVTLMILKMKEILRFKKRALD